MGGGFYMQYLESLCRRRGWTDPSYEIYRSHSGYTCLVLVNGREYQTDLAYASDTLAQENAAMRAFMVCRNFSVNGGMLARNGIVQGLPADESARSSRHGKSSSGSSGGSSGSSGRRHGSSTGGQHQHQGTTQHHHHSGGGSGRSSRSHRSSGHHSSSSSTASFE